MVLAELGIKIKDALNKLSKAEVIDKKLLTEVLNQIATALMSADVNIKIVAKLKNNIVSQFEQIEEESGNKRLIIQRAVVKELQNMLTTEKKPYVLKKGKPNIVMFVGLQGSGKTTTCTKYAFHYMKKGWKVALVCADTFRAGAFDQLKQNATKCRIPFYGSYTEMDPVKIAEEGVTYFKKQNIELIIVDTSGRHKQEEGLFEEMKQVAEVTNPDDIIFVMDSHIGQACHLQASAFKKTVDIGSVIITKLDGHAKGGGALSAVTATESPITFIGTGEHFEDLEPFNPESFIKRLLGLGDIKGLFEKVKEVVSPENQMKLAENLQKGIFTLRDMRDQYTSVLKMGPLDKVMTMIPGLSEAMIPQGKSGEATAKIKKYLCMMDSMTDEELNKKKKIDESRARRIARGSGSLPEEVMMLLDEYGKFAKMVEKFKTVSKGKGDLNNFRNPGQLASQLGSIVPQNLLNQLGGAGNLMNMVKEMGSMEGMSQLMGGMGGMGSMGGGGGNRRKKK
jgi:signal recognition particle subunit SRP54